MVEDDEEADEYMESEARIMLSQSPVRKHKTSGYEEFNPNSNINNLEDQFVEADVRLTKGSRGISENRLSNMRGKRTSFKDARDKF